jgi:hypothetical protein
LYARARDDGAGRLALCMSADQAADFHTGPDPRSQLSALGKGIASRRSFVRATTPLKTDC